MMMPGRSYSAESGYRYGFNGKENDNEVKGEGNQQDYGMRIYDPRIGKFLSIDPFTKSFPWYTPYQYAGNTPIQAVDLDGAEEYHYLRLHDDDGNVVLAQIDKKDIVERILVGFRSGHSLANDAPVPMYDSRVNQKQKYIVHDTYTTMVDVNPTFGNKPIQEERTYSLKWNYKSEDDARQGIGGTRDAGDWLAISLERSGKALKEENAANGGPGMVANLTTYALRKVANKAFAYLAKKEFQNLNTTGLVDSRTIRFSQNSISENFKDGMTARSLIDKLKSGEKVSMEPIRIVEKDGLVFTLDNRRLYAYQQAGVEIPYVKLNQIPNKENFKFTTTNQGTSIEVRPAKTDK